MINVCKEMINIDHIQIFGERCSGTNYLEHLLKENFCSIKFPWEYGWKHGFPPPDIPAADNCLFVVIHRHPYDWIRSFHRNPWHSAWELRNLDFSEFIRREWWCVWDQHAFKNPDDPVYGKEMMGDRDPDTGKRFANVLKLRSAKLRSWLQLQDRVPHCIHIRYEDLSADPETVLADLASRFNLHRDRAFRNIDGDKGGSIPYQRRRYDHILTADLDYMRNELDSNIESRVGYDLSRLPEN